MTAEIAIMNRQAVALAADSAVTIKTNEGPKVYNTVNKLFMLSQEHPVGVMIYGAASFFDIPWSIIVKEYRKHIGKKEFDTLESQIEHFLTYLRNNTNFFPEDRQKIIFERWGRGFFYSIVKAIENEIKSKIECEIELSTKDISDICGSVIRGRYKRLSKVDDLPTIPENHFNKLLDSHSDILNNVYDEVFEKLPLYKKDKALLFKMPPLYFCKNYFPDNCSGVVIAGYGKNDFFPKLSNFKLETIVGGELKFFQEDRHTISYDQGVSIVPFAQSEMVHTFMEGIDPELDVSNRYYLREVFKKYPDSILSVIKGLNIETTEELKGKILNTGSTLFENYIKDLNTIREKNYVAPVIQAVAILPKDELAAMAEALVNLTKLKRRVTFGAETVGGPVDVAIISKGDGFVWIKRKQYFDKNLNPRYLGRVTHLNGEG